MPRHSRSSQSVTLFPFLAVLVCAMGALIFLLLVTTRYIRSDTENTPESPAGIGGLLALGPQSVTAAPQPPRHPQPESERQPEALHVAGAMPLPALNLPTLPIVAPLTPTVTHPATSHTSIAQLRADLQNRQHHLQHRRSELEALRNQAAKTQADITRLKQQTQTARKHNQDRQRRHRELLAAAEELKRQITQLERQLQQQRVQGGGTENRFAFVAYDGRDGTLRRPILIECTPQGFRFLSEDIGLGREDFRGFIPAVNPLLAGSRALLQHLQSPADTGGPNQQPAPYVLLLVRPKGINTYYAARRMLGQLGTDFGYELVEADAEISVPASSPDAVAACRRAIESLLAQRDDIAQLARTGSRPLIPDQPTTGQPSGNGRRTLQMTRNGRIQVHAPGTGNGGTRATPGSGRPGRDANDSFSRTQPADPATHPFINGTPPGQPGGGARGNPRGTSPALTAAGNSADGTQATPRIPAQPDPNGGSVRRDFQRGSPRRIRGNSASGNSALGGRSPGTNGGATAGTQPSSRGSGQGSAVPTRNGSAGRHNAPGTGPGNPLPGATGRFPNRSGQPGPLANTGNDRTQRPGGLPGTRSQLANQTPTGSPQGSTQGPTAPVGQAGTAQRGGQQAPDRNPALRNGNHGLSQTAPGGTDGNPHSTADGSGAGTAAGARGGTSRTPGPDTRSDRRPASGSTPSGTAGHRSPIARLNSPAAGASAGPASGNTGGGSPSTMGSGQPGQSPSSAQIGGSFGRSRPRTSTSNRRSRKRTWGLIGRQASIGFERNVLIDVTADKITVGKAFVVSGQLEHRSLVHFVVEAIDRHARSWGRPPDSFYWVPSLQFVVAPDGQSNLKILKSELRSFGLPIRVRNRSEPHEQQPSQRP